MWVVVITSFIAVILSYLSQFKGKSKLFELGFIIVTFIAAIHYDYGNDYRTYYYTWNQIRNDSWGNILASDMYGAMETGWAVLNRIFGFDGGFFVMVALLNILQNYIYYKLIKNFVSPAYLWLAMLLYLCNSSLYLLNFSMMRQGLAVALFVAAIIFITKRKLFISVLTLFFASTIHRTSMIGIPFLILYFTPLKKTKTLSIVVASFTIVLFFISAVASSVFNAIINNISLLERYGETGGGEVSQENLGIGFWLLHIPHIVILYSLWTGAYFRNTYEKIITVVAFFDVIILPFTYVGSAFLSRLVIYFIAFQVAVVPMLYSRLRNNGLRVALTVIFVFMLLYTYRLFFLTSYWKDTYGGPFHTIFSVL